MCRGTGPEDSRLYRKKNYCQGLQLEDRVQFWRMMSDETRDEGIANAWVHVFSCPAACDDDGPGEVNTITFCPFGCVAEDTFDAAPATLFAAEATAVDVSEAFDCEASKAEFNRSSTESYDNCKAGNRGLRMRPPSRRRCKLHCMHAAICCS